MLGLLLPADHPVWTAREVPLPVEAGDSAAALAAARWLRRQRRGGCAGVAAPGWLVSGTRADGVVRVLDHGTDHAVEGSLTPDDPLYARLSASTATCPDLGAAAAGDPLDGAVVVLDASGR